MKLLAQLFCVLAIPVAALAGTNSTVTMTGLVYDQPESHTTLHNHSLEFQAEGSDKSYSIVNSPEVERMHHENNRNYRANVEGYVTPKFLFFGGNLVITKFEVVGQSEVIALNSPKPRVTREFNR